MPSNSAAMQEAVKAITQITSVNELEEVRTKLDRQMASRRIEERNDALAKMHEVAASVGMPLAALMGTKLPKIATKASVKYRHPEDSKLQWSGRGRRPQWVSEWIGGGRLLTDIEIVHEVN